MNLKKIGSRLQSVVVLAALAILLGIASPFFLTTDNLLNVLQQSAINAILGIGLTFVIISGGIDLSVGSIMALCGLVVADLLVAGHGPVVAIGAGMLLGMGCGAVNGLITTVARIPPFIATLGMMLIARSAAKIYSGSQPISGLPESYLGLSGTVGGVPIAVFIVAALYAVAHVVLTRTRLGRYTYAIGGNEQAAWLSGVSTGAYKVSIYALSGLLAGVAAVLMSSRLNAASPLAGEMYELYAIAAAVIGGVSLMGGEGYVVGTLIGALIMGMLRNGLNLLNVPSAWEGVVVGGVLVLAVIVDRARHRAAAGPGPAGLRRYRKLLATVVTCLVLAAGSVLVRLHGADGGDSGQLTVAFIPKSIGDPFWVTMKRAAEREGARLKARVITAASERETDVERQFQVMENMIEQKVGAIVLAPAGSKEVILAIRKANDTGIPVIIVDSDVDHKVAAKVGAKTATYIGSDNVKGGNIAGHYLAKKLGGSGGIVVIEGTTGHESTDRRVAGFRAAISKYPAIKIVASQTANAERERGFTVAQNMLQSHPKLRAFFAANDQMALGALEAVDAAQRLGSVHVVGFDASADAVKNIRSGRMLGSVAQYPSEMGRLGVLHAVNLLRGGRPPPRIIHTRVEMIDASNVARFASSSGPGSRLRIGLVTHSTKNPYWKRLVDGASGAAKKLKAEVLWRAPEHAYDVEQQLGLVSQLLAQGVDGIILAPAGARTMALAVRMANQAKVPLLVVDTPLDRDVLSQVGGKTLGYVGSDNLAGGRLAGTFVARRLARGGRVAILQGAPQGASTSDRERGFRQVLQGRKDVRVVAAATAYCERPIAKTVAAMWLQTHPELKVIFATNGLMALGALDAITEAAKASGKAPAVEVVAFDATPDVMREVKSGRIVATVAQEPREMGARAVRALLASLKGPQQPIHVLTRTRLVEAGSKERPTP